MSQQSGRLAASEERSNLMSRVLKLCVAQFELQTALDIHASVAVDAKSPSGSGRFGGSTATIITVSKFKRLEEGGEQTEVLQVVGAVLGDSRAVLSRGGVAIPLMQDHRVADNRDERDRVLKAGAEIRNDRIWGDLQTSRSIGDLPYKKRTTEVVESLLARASPERRASLDPNDSLRMAQDNFWTDDQAVTSLPDLFSLQVDLSDSDDDNSVEFLILASDGLWDFVNSQEAVNFVRSDLLETQDLHMAAVSLVGLAQRRAQGNSDNISVVIMAFNQGERKFDCD